MNNILKLAVKFENQLKKAQLEQTQLGTTELFFDNSTNQQKFASAVQDQNGTIAKYLLNIYSKKEQDMSFNVKIEAIPGKGASWIIKVLPNSLHESICKMLDIEFKKIVGKSMQDKLIQANNLAKSGNGSGTLNVASLDIG